MTIKSEYCLVVLPHFLFPANVNQTSLQTHVSTFLIQHSKGLVPIYFSSSTSVCSYLKNLDLLSKLLCRAKLFHKKCIQPRGLNTEHTNIFYQSENQYNKYKTVNVSLRNLLKLAMSLNTVEEGFKQYYHLKHNNIQRGWCGLR